MTTKFSKFFVWATLCLGLAAVNAACSESKDDEPGKEQADEFKVNITLPSAIEVEEGSDCLIPLQEGHGVLATDAIQIHNDGLVYTCNINSIENNALAFTFPEKLGDGTYKLQLVRGQRKKDLGSVKIRRIDKKFPLDPSTTVYGTVRCAGKGVANVLVSDGIEFAKTDADGRYQLASKKELGYVFVVVPSGYEVAKTNGVVPEHFATLLGDGALPENASFELKQVNQNSYKVLYLGDMHIANRTGDIKQFTEWSKDFNAYCDANASTPTYVMTLGDMTWDIYWDKYTLDKYINLVGGLCAGKQFYHTIGNHDNDYATTTNKLAKAPFRKIVGPNYYSLNIGQVHYIVLDDIDCSTYDGTKSRNYKRRLFDDQLAWLQRDLSYVDKSTPVCVMMHAPFYSASSPTVFGYALNGTYDEIAQALNGYTVHFVTGHTHTNFNVTPDLGNKFYEHNVAAVCSDWWWSGNLTGVLVSTDGTPSGYAINTVVGKEMTWDYKSAGKDISHQFRSYDLNQVKFDRLPNLSAGTEAYNKWENYVKTYTGAEKNEVLLNVWNYNPKWTVTATLDNGTKLTVKQEKAYDPLHILAQTKERMSGVKAGTTQSAPNFPTELRVHHFRVTGIPDATSTVNITVTDDHGNTFTEKMARPKKFDLATYK